MIYNAPVMTWLQAIQSADYQPHAKARIIANWEQLPYSATIFYDDQCYQFQARGDAFWLAMVKWLQYQLNQGRTSITFDEITQTFQLPSPQRKLALWINQLWGQALDVAT